VIVYVQNKSLSLYFDIFIHQLRCEFKRWS